MTPTLGSLNHGLGFIVPEAGSTEIKVSAQVVSSKGQEGRLYEGISLWFINGHLCPPPIVSPLCLSLCPLYKDIMQVCSVTSDSLLPPWTVTHQPPLSIGLSQARLLWWVAISSSTGSSWLSDRTHISCISCSGRGILYHWITWEALHKDTQSYWIKGPSSKTSS